MRQIHLWKTKLKVLAKSGKRPKVQTQDPDASLLVEPPIVKVSSRLGYMRNMLKCLEEDGAEMVDLDLDFDVSPQHLLKTRTNLPNLRVKKRRFNPVAIGD